MPTGRPWLAAAADGLLDAAVVVMATWTVVYHLCLVLRLGVWWAVALEAAALTAVVVAAVRRRRAAAGASPGSAAGAGPPPGSPDEAIDISTDAPGPVTTGLRTRLDRWLVGGVVAATAVAATVAAVEGPWPLVAACWLLAAVGGAVLAAARLRRSRGSAAGPPAQPIAARGWATASGVVAVLWAIALAVLSLFTRRSNPDDLYYVNLSQWVSDSGTFPLRDTIFSDLVYPMSSWPPVASYDALSGTVAYFADVRAASVVYLVVPPLATFLAVLALWRLLREWRLPAVGVALSVALVFLLYDGGPGYAAPGNLFLTRIWQGKVILLSVGVPLLLAYGLRYLDQPTRRRAGWLAAGGVAATGLTTTAMFLVPLLAVTIAAPMMVRRRWGKLTGPALLAAYPLLAGMVTLAVGGRSADFFETRRLFRFDPAWFGPEILRDGPIAVVAVAAVLVGALVLPRVDARVMTGVAAAIVGVTFVPGVTQVVFEVVGLGPTLWRVSWITPIAALVGAVAVLAGAWVGRRGASAVTATAVAVVLIGSGTPIWDDILAERPLWKVSFPVSAREVIAEAEDGDVVLAPQGLAVTLAVLTTDVKTVAPRAYFMDYLRDEPTFDYDERQVLLDFVNEPFYSWHREQVTRALAVVDPDQVCVRIWHWDRREFLRELDYALEVITPNFRCYVPEQPVSTPTTGPVSPTLPSGDLR